MVKRIGLLNSGFATKRKPFRRISKEKLCREYQNHLKETKGDIKVIAGSTQDPASLNTCEGVPELYLN